MRVPVLPELFLVNEADTAAIRATFDEQSELSAAIELRRRFPGITDDVKVHDDVRTISGTKPLFVGSVAPSGLPDHPSASA